MTKYLAAACVVAFFAGCGSPTTPTGDSGVTTDAGTTTDAGAKDAGGNNNDAGSVADSGTATDAGTTDAGVAAATCATYCANIQANCTGANIQYNNADSCLGACAAFMQGAAGATSGNNLECRAYHAKAAQALPATHCPHAGPSGDGVCGNNCDGFCAIALNACTGANTQFASENACQTACTGFANASAHYNSTTTSGNSFACRMYHLSVAATAGGGQANTHCPHIPASSPPCQ